MAVDKEESTYGRHVNTINGAISHLGYSGEEMTAHGFRTMASTLLNEQGVHPDLIELQLAHAERKPSELLTTVHNDWRSGAR